MDGLAMTISERLPSIRVTASVVACAAVVACGGPPVVRNGPAQERVVSRNWSEGAPAIRAAVIDAFGEQRRTLLDPFNQMIVNELKLPRFTPDWLVGYVDPGEFLKAYKALDPAVRSNDIWIEDPIGDTYWLSEYERPDGPVRFRCGFVLHFVESPTGTTIEAYESVPEVWAGEHWAWAMHGVGFGRFHDIRFVEPTVQDRIRVLDVIDDIVKKRG